MPDSEYQIRVSPTSTADVGSYTVTLTVEMVEYSATPPNQIEIDVIVESGINLAPYFAPPLSDLFPLSIEQSQQPQSWTFELPDVYDEEGSSVEIDVEIASSGSFLEFDSGSSELVIADLSDGTVEAGAYNIVIILDDGENRVSETVTIEVLGVEEEQAEDSTPLNESIHASPAIQQSPQV